MFQGEEKQKIKRFKLKLTDGRIINCCLNQEELVYGATAVAVNSSFLGKDEGVVYDLYAYHPLTGEKLKVLSLNDENLTSCSMLLVPLHVQEHLLLAKKYNLELKQVVCPYFQGEGSQTVRQDLPVNIRRSVCAIIKHPTEDKYLCEDSLVHSCKSFVLGGREGKETAAEAAIREVVEETGYKNVVIDETCPIVMHNHFYADYKGVNRYAYLSIVFGHLVDDKREERTEEEKKKCSVLWVKREDLLNFLSVKNNIFACKILLNGLTAFEEDGKLTNSYELDGLNREQAKIKINEIWK